MAVLFIGMKQWFSQLSGIVLAEENVFSRSFLWESISSYT